MLSSSRAIQTGSFLGSYELLRRLATGGMADVFLARQVLGGRSERLVVLKSILSGLADRPEFVSMFLDEARLAAQLQHPNVVQILDVSMLGNRPCIVMEYLNGFDAAWIYRRSALIHRVITPAETAALAAGAAYGLGYAHRKAALDGTPLRIVHRDVSPHNVLLTREGVVKILDFGIARTSQQIHTTQAGVLKGKIPYMSPEQMAGQPIDGRADLFGLGVVMWELTTGSRLFRRETEVLSMQAVLFDVIPPPSSARPEIPPELDDIIMKALDRDPDQRYATGEDLAQDLERFVQSAQSGAPHLLLSRLIEELAEPGELDPLASAGPITLETPSMEPLMVAEMGHAGRSADEPATAATIEANSVRTRTLPGLRQNMWWAVAAALAALAGGLTWMAARGSGPSEASERPTEAVTAEAERPTAANTEVPAPSATPATPAAAPAPGDAPPAATVRKAVGRRTPRAGAPTPTPTPTPPPPAANPVVVAAPPPVRTPEKTHSPRREESSGTGVSLDTDYQ